MKNSNKFGCLAIIVMLMIILARCSSCANSNAHQHEGGIYDVEITKVQSKDGDFILKGKTDAPNGSKVLAQGTLYKDENEASAVDDDNYAKVKDHKFTVQVDTAYLTDKDIVEGLKVKVKIFAIEKYSSKYDDYNITKKVQKIIAQEIKPTSLTVTKKIADYYVDEDDDSDEDSEDADNDDSNSDTTDTEDEKSDSKSEDMEKAESESKSDDKDDSSDNEKSQSTSDTMQKNDNADKGTTNNSDETQAGKIYTGNSDKIVGNARTHKYHVPGQAGYTMNSENAVYFNSEQEAQAAGYVRSKR